MDYHTCNHNAQKSDKSDANYVSEDKKCLKPKASIPVTAAKRANKIDRMVYGKRGNNISNAAKNAYGNIKK